LREKSELTAKTYRSAIADCLQFCQCGLSELTFTALQNWREYLGESHKVTTANKKLSSLRSLLSFACDMGYLPQNPAAKLKNVKPSKDKSKQSKSVVERIITPDEVKLLVDSASMGRDRCMIKTCYLLGLRIHELLNLHWGDFSRTPKGGWRVKIIGKGAKERIISIPDGLVDELKEIQIEGYLFRNYMGEQLSVVGAHKMLKGVVNQAGLPSDISWHWLRHCSASHSIANGASLESVRKKLGHSSIAVTGIYVHSDEDANQFLWV